MFFNFVFKSTISGKRNTVEMRKRYQISTIALILTILLAYPEAVKSFHTHHNQIGDGGCSCTTGYHTQEKACLVCDFEFVNFIAEPLVYVNYFPFVFAIVNQEKATQTFPEFPDYFSLRAPPATT